MRYPLLTTHMSGSPIIQDGKLVGAVTHVILLCGGKSGSAKGGVGKLKVENGKLKIK